VRFPARGVSNADFGLILSDFYQQSQSFVFRVGIGKNLGDIRRQERQICA